MGVVWLYDIWGWGLFGVGFCVFGGVRFLVVLVFWVLGGLILLVVWLVWVGCCWCGCIWGCGFFWGWVGVGLWGVCGVGVGGCLCGVGLVVWEGCCVWLGCVWWLGGLGCWVVEWGVLGVLWGGGFSGGGWGGCGGGCVCWCWGVVVVWGGGCVVWFLI
uniref:NADH dehydrogenase subunit 6 n=1 Tax=Knipowitschia caucasica TaxID=637954 RepID=A0AAV2KTE3_KNICA